MADSSARVSVVIPTYRRKAQLAETLARILSCEPPPAEVIVHVDGGDDETASLLAADFPDVRILQSVTRMGPGGGRNKAVAAATQEIVASFDDDSYPLDGDYFGRVCKVLALRADAAVVASKITDRGMPIAEAEAAIGPTVHFGGGGVAYRREEFLACGGYVPLAVAYGMEEVDFCIRILDRGKKIYFTPWLRVFHDNDLSHHANASITAASITNQALLVFLRYPIRYWPYGSMQVLNRVVWLIRARRIRGLVSGLVGIPAHIWRHRQMRATVKPETISAFLQARHSSAALEPLSV